MVILGGLELVAAGYILKEMHNDGKEEEREREKRRRRRRHSREDHHRPHHHDDPSPNRPSRPPQQQQLRPPQQPGGPPRPYSAPPPQNRPPMMPMAAASVPMWHPQQQQGPPPQQGPPQSHGTWPQGPPSQQQRPSQPQSQWPGSPPPPNNANSNFVPPPLQRPATMYPPPGVHIDLKTGKIQHDMYPPEMPRPGEAREYYEGGRKEYDRMRENSMPTQQRPQHYQPISGDHGLQHSYSQPQINVTPAHNPTPPPPQGYAELDAETPGRFRPSSNEKSGRGKSSSFSARYRDDDVDMRDPPPAYRE
ncbi:uncharacterized protein Z520_00571 [Fonsecaea multimorphosa CBS 102226]|uniref:Uncharacterized protein n=1 Tax=Fonsecaea multimorphosa CBS 102226 TaxID=1442371 RepID=A0A0D2KKA5_9EURO|nr:uncharacterized protein Z520_00571 [Fonsecaea multimorphosa CBS 102226]KIY03880.1 hypothetical protein Z520_00571 [Fonsecaea multimorphosa CBS 102226]OAL32141.1 hypothetical protein AYO22_00590 [Fonsecaea multimorphosa]